MHDWLAIVILAVIEGITEFLPISSTGHLLLVENSGLVRHQSELFNVVIQAGAVLAVFLVFSRRVKELALNLRDPATRDYLAKLTVAFVLTLAGVLAARALGARLPEALWPIASATLVGGVVILAVEWWVKGRPAQSEVTWRIAVVMAVGQVLAAVFPGTSRAGATIILALAFGITRAAATEFSFLLGIPTMFAASAFAIYKGVSAPAPGDTPWEMVAVGTVVSAAVAFVAVRWLLRFIQTHTFVGFGWYRIALGLALVALELA